MPNLDTPEPVSPEGRDPLLLLGEGNRLLRERLRQGAAPPDAAAFLGSLPRFKSRSAIEAPILRWLETYPACGFEPLQDLLFRDPQAIGHPVVLGLLERLGAMIPARPSRPFSPPDRLRGDDPRTFVPENALWGLVRSWLLGRFEFWRWYGFDIRPVWARRRGRRGLDERDRGWLLWLADEMSGALDRELETARKRAPLSNPYRRRRGEPVEVYRQRLAGLVTTCCRAVGASGPSPTETQDILRRAGIYRVRSQPRRLVYEVLAHLLGMRAHQVRGLIEREQAAGRRAPASR
jgi:hypothetical protein